MSTTWIVTLFCAAALSGAEQRHAGMIMSMSLSDGLFVMINTVCEPVVAGTSPFSCFSGNGIYGSIHVNPLSHILSAPRTTKTWVGYSFDARKTGQGAMIELTLAPATGPGPKGLTQVPLPKFDGGPFIIEPGNIVRIPLLVSMSTGQTLVDEIQIFTRPVSSEEVFANSLGTAEPRDFTVQDVEMKWLNGTVFLNGMEAQTIHGGSTGQVIWYSYEGIGTAVLSLVPQSAPGFQKAGTIHGRTLQFQVGSDLYEWKCTEPILPGDGPYNLYVHWDSRAKKLGEYGSSSTGELALEAIADSLADDTEEK